MCALAEILVNAGFTLTGSEIQHTDITDRLSKLGIDIALGHSVANIEGRDIALVVRSAAIADTNVEIVLARELNIPIVSRGEMLAAIMRYYQGIAVCGTHGKTTTTSLVYSVLQGSGFDPSCVVGGSVKAEDASGMVGKGRLLVAEGDESDGSFALLQPDIAVITNIDHDHLDYYGNSFAELKKTFVRFIEAVPVLGKTVINGDDDNCADLLQINRPHVTFGLGPACDYRATDIRYHGGYTEFQLIISESSYSVHLPLMGEHNVYNALAALAVAGEMKADIGSAVASLARFQGVRSRMEQLHCDADTSKRFNNNMAVYPDIYLDYGHHPLEIDVNVRALKSAYPDRRIVMVYEPHRYSRTKLHLEGFVDSLAVVDELVLMPVYAASETIDMGIDIEPLAEKLTVRRGRQAPVVDAVSQLTEWLRSTLKDGDILIFQGAGKVQQVGIEVANSLYE